MVIVVFRLLCNCAGVAFAFTSWIVVGTVVTVTITSADIGPPPLPVKGTGVMGVPFTVRLKSASP